MEKVHDLGTIVPEQLEQLGTKFKFWYDGNKYLFKSGIPGTGENWSEVLASRVCDLLGIPHANYYFAKWKDKEGVICRNFIPADGRLVHGNEMLARYKDDYRTDMKYNQREHTLPAVLSIMRLKKIGHPLDSSFSVLSLEIIDVFLGYVLLDALIANQDRHHQNWGFVITGEKAVHLAPSFDHASGFGSHETDKNRKERLETKDRRYNIEAYAEKARTPFYPRNSVNPFTTLEALSHVSKYAPSGFKFWKNQLEKTSSDDFGVILCNIDDTLMSAPSKDFSSKLFKVNKERILNLKCG